MTTETQPLLKLTDLQQHPEMLIPDKLIQSVPTDYNLHIAHIPEMWRGRFDDEYLPALTIVAAESPEVSHIKNFDTGSVGGFDRVLDSHHKIAAEQGLLPLQSDPLFLFIALEGYRERGIYIDEFIISRDMRGQGLGVAFYRNFENIASEMGYKYIFGRHAPDSVGFYEGKLDRFRADELNQTGFRLVGFKNSALYKVTVKFLDPDLEFDCLRRSF